MEQDRRYDHDGAHSCSNQAAKAFESPLFIGQTSICLGQPLLHPLRGPSSSMTPHEVRAESVR